MNNSRALRPAHLKRSNGKFTGTEQDLVTAQNGRSRTINGKTVTGRKRNNDLILYDRCRGNKSFLQMLFKTRKIIPGTDVLVVHRTALPLDQGFCILPSYTAILLPGERELL